MSTRAMVEPTHSTNFDIPISAWVVLGIVVITSVAIDLFGHRGNHSVSRKSAVLWSIGWIVLAVLFGGWVAYQFGAEAGQDYFTAYLLEKSLSLDNLFVFLIVFSRLKIPQTEQHRVLQWGIIGAFVTRALFIGAGTAILQAWHGVVYVLGAFLIFTGVRTVWSHNQQNDDDDDEGRVLPFLRKHLPFTPKLDGHAFITLENGKRLATPLFMALIVIEITDVLFAVDSIPAVFAITEEPFLVYSSNIFAILGLRALYLVLAELIADLKYLHYGLGAILVFAGAKMLGSNIFHIPHVASLGAIVGILIAVIIPSVIARRRERRRAAIPSPT